MTPGDREALEALGLRLRHVAATASLIALHTSLGRDECDAIGGIAATLDELHERLGTMTSPAAAAS